MKCKYCNLIINVDTPICPRCKARLVAKETPKKAKKTKKVEKPSEKTEGFGLRVGTATVGADIKENTDE